jgi:hypothetical protein
MFFFTLKAFDGNFISLLFHHLLLLFSFLLFLTIIITTGQSLGNNALK